MTEPSVAIVMRTRDRPLFLERALRSVARQTFDDYELVVVNDGGDSDAVDALVERHAPNARVVHNSEAVGLYSPPNEPIRESDARYAVVHDDDDTWHPEFLERMTGHLEGTGAMAVVATTDKVFERVEGGRVVEVERTRLHPGVEHINLYAMCFENFATPIAFLYRRECWEAIGGYEERLGTVADWDFAIRFLQRFEIELLQTPEALAYYHHRVGDAGDANVVYTSRHRRAENELANEYLRRDLEAGKLGLGFIMNALRYGYGAREGVVERLESSADERAEYLADCVRKVESRVTAVEQAITPAERLRSDIRFVRSLPRKIAKRKRP